MFGKCVSLAGTDFFTAEEVGLIMFEIWGTKAGKVMDNQRSFSFKHRMYREVLQSLPKGHMAFESEEIIVLNNMDRNVALIGFKTHVPNVSEILNTTRTISFVQTGKRVIFDNQIEFSNGKCCLIIKSKVRRRVNVLHVPQSTNAKMCILNYDPVYGDNYAWISVLLYTYLN